MPMIKAIFFAGFLAMLTACNTVAGFGEDITANADWAKRKISGSSKPTEDQKNSFAQGVPRLLARLQLRLGLR